MPSADAEPVAEPGEQQLLANPDFEEGAAGWQIDGDAAIGDSTDLGVSIIAASGREFAQVGRKNSSNNGIAQAVTVPDGTVLLRLTGQRCFDSDDDDGSRDDVVNIFLLDSEGNQLETLLDSSNAEIGAVCTWTGFAAVAASSHAGEEIQLAIVSESDGSDVTAFWFDDLRLIATIQ